jgi:hypothetical protein
VAAAVGSVLFAASAIAQQAGPAGGEPTTAVLRQCSDEIVRGNVDAKAVERAKKFLALTGKRAWTYTDRGQTKSYEGAYDSEVVRGNQRSVMFTSRAYVPVELLSAADQAVFAEIVQLRTSVADDWSALQQALVQRQAELAEQDRRRAEEQQAAFWAQHSRRFQLLFATDVTVTSGGIARVTTLGAGEVFTLVDELPDAVVLLVGGVDQVAVPKSRVREVAPILKAQVVLRPNLDGPPPAPAGMPIGVPLVGGPLPAAAPPRLDCEVDSVAFPDGRQQLIVRTVPINSLGQRFGLRPGDILVRVNDIGVGTLDDYRIASSQGGGGLKLDVFRPAINNSLIIVIPPLQPILP